MSQGMDSRYQELLLHLGLVLGGLQTPELRARIVAQVSAGQLSPGYLTLIRNRLDEVLSMSIPTKEIPNG